MSFAELKNRPGFNTDFKVNQVYLQFNAFLQALSQKQLTESIIHFVNEEIREINSKEVSSSEFKSLIRQKQSNMIKRLEKEAKIVPKNYYRNQWLAIGMSAFGLPIGIAIGLSMGNIGLLSIGLPIGMAIGMGVGTKMDAKAFEEGRQLDFENKAL